MIMNVAAVYCIPGTRVSSSHVSPRLILSTPCEVGTIIIPGSQRKGTAAGEVKTVTGRCDVPTQVYVMPKLRRSLNRPQVALTAGHQNTFHWL